MLKKSKENNLNRDVILASSLKLANKALETYPSNKPLQEIIEPIAEFMISLLADSIILIPIMWDNYTEILKNWSIKSERITDY